MLPEKLQLVSPPMVGTDKVSAGHHAVDLAIAMGAVEIGLLGFDCRLVDGRSNNPDDYRNKHPRLYTDYFLPAWTEYPARARQGGVAIINATPNSAIEVFPMAPLQELL